MTTQKIKTTVATFGAMKAEGKRISMLTCYDYTTARLIEESSVNAILVGDSLGNVMLGYPDTLAVTVEDMITYGAAVVRGVKNTLIGRSASRIFFCIQFQFAACSGKRPVCLKFMGFTWNVSEP